MFYRSGDPDRDFDRWDAHQAMMEARLPKCENKRCQKRIDDEHYFEIDGEILCLECVIEKYGHSTEEYAEGCE